MRLLSLASVLVLVAAPLCAADAPPPISAFARLPHLSDPVFSPDGTKILALMGIGDLRTAVVIDAATQSMTPVLGSQAGKFSLTWCDWANETRVLCGYRAIDLVYHVSYYYALTRLVAANADASQQKVLVQKTQRWGNNQLQFQDRVLALTPEDPRTILVSARADGDSYPGVYELDVYSGTMRVREAPREPFINYYSDEHGEIRLALGYRNRFLTWHARASAADTWRELSRRRVFEDDSLRPVDFAAEATRFYAVGTHEGRNALWLIDLEDIRTPELIFSHPHADVRSTLAEGRFGRMLGVLYETDMPFVHYIDPAADALAHAVRKALPNQFVLLSGQTRDGRLGIVQAMSDVQSVTYYLYDRQKATLSLLGSQYPELDKTKLAMMRPISYPARDGTRIPGYITTPVGADKGMPLVVMPHGGPATRDSWGFDFLVQFLASRGYAVLQMNFRGSVGYGKQWLDAARQDWGGLPYDDIVDGTKWAVETGLADTERVCIVGWSFGGYAALIGAVRDPGLFRCAASVAGVSDLRQRLREGRYFSSEEARREQLGSDGEKLERDSPRRHAEQVRIPVLLVHGKKDTVVPDEHSQHMADALRKARKEVEYVRLENADHSIDDVASRTITLQKLEGFLAKHLGAGAAVRPSGPADRVNQGATNK